MRLLIGPGQVSPRRARQGGGPAETSNACRGDAGVTLMEVSVGLAVMGTFLVMFTAAVLQMFSTTNQVESLSTAQSQLGIALQRLDTDIRYASSIDPAGVVNGQWYVEYLTTSSSAATCTGLKLAEEKLWRATWPQTQASPRPTWLPLASGIGPAANRPAFEAVVAAPEDGAHRAQLRLHLAVTGGDGRDAAASQAEFTFTAVNSSVQLPVVAQCARPNS